MGEYKRLALRIIIGACLIVVAFAGHAAQAETKEVVAAVARDFYPEYVVDADGRPAGLGIDLMNAAAKRAGLSVIYRVFEAWSDLVVALERGDADVVPVLSITPAREGRMLFTHHHLQSRPPCGRRDRSSRERRRYLVGTETRATLSGEVDASFQSWVWKVSKRARLADRINVVGDPLTEVKRAIAVRKDLPDLRDRLVPLCRVSLSSSLSIKKPFHTRRIPSPYAPYRNSGILL